jgi:hypothetical protein
VTPKECPNACAASIEAAKDLLISLLSRDRSDP